MSLERTLGQKIIAFLFFFLACFGAAAVGALATFPSVPGWYASLNRPSFAPPNVVFGPVWTLLYLMMASAAFRVWLKVGLEKAQGALWWFFIQLFLNAAWSVLFFGMHRSDLALTDIAMLWLSIGITILCFYQADSWAGLLMIPYWFWVSFAAVLNFSFYRLNP